MKTCIKCGSHAFNLYAEGIDQGGFCDVHYWQGRAHRAEAQPEQEPVCEITVKNGHWIDTNGFSGVKDLANGIHKLYTTPPKRPWVGLTDDEIWKFWWSRPEVLDGEDDSMEAEFVAAVRRVLAAHDIKENT